MAGMRPYAAPSLPFNRAPSRAVPAPPPSPPRARAPVLVLPQRPFPKGPLAQWLLLSILLHVLGILLFGAPAGGSREGRAMFGSLSVVIMPAAPPAPELRLAPELSLTPLKPQARVERLPRPVPVPPPQLGITKKMEAAPVVVPKVIDRLVPAERKPDVVPPPQVPLPTPPQEAPPPAIVQEASPPAVVQEAPPPAVVQEAPAPVAVEPAPAPMPTPPPPAPAPVIEAKPIEAPALPVTPPAPPAPQVERAPPVAVPAPTPAPPVEVQAPKPVPAEPIRSAPPLPEPVREPPKAEAREPPPQPREAPREPPPVQPAPAPVQRVAPKIEPPASAFRPRVPGPDIAAPAPGAPPDYDPTAAPPSVDLDGARRRAGQLAREGTGNRALLPFAMPPVQKPKSKMESAIENARKPDCRTAYKDLGLAAVVPLIANEFGEGNCRW